MPTCFFATDLHGHLDRYEKLLARIAADRPAAVLLGGDLLPNPFLLDRSLSPEHVDFVNGFLAARFLRLRDELVPHAPEVFLILGNDDGRVEEAACLDAATRGAWHYVHDRHVPFAGYDVYGYAFVPPTPFRLKDWERYDVSRYVDPGCVSPEEGTHSFPATESDLRYRTIQQDLAALFGDRALDRAIGLFHSPPYRTALDRAALDGKSIDHVPLDVHVGSIAIRRFIEARQPRVTLHGHVHESARITGSWRDRIGRTRLLGAAHDGPELALVVFDPDDPDGARRELV